MVRKLLQGKFFRRSVSKANNRCHRNVMRHLEFSVTDRRPERAASLEFQWIKVRTFIEVIDVSILLSHVDTSVTGSKRSSTLTFVRLATAMLFVNTCVGIIPHRAKM
jgi:hypothetical protein